MTAGIEFTGLFGDVVYVSITVAFFALALGLLRGCERLTGPAEPDTTGQAGRADDAAPQAVR